MSAEISIQMNRFTERDRPRQFDERCERIARAAAIGLFLPNGDAEDLLQEARIGVWQALKDWRPDSGSSFDGFAKMLGRRRVLDAVTAARRARRHPDQAPLRLDAPIGDESGDLIGARIAGRGRAPDEIAADREQLVLVFVAVGRLSGLEREAFVRCVLGGEPYEAVGPEKSVDNALQRVRHRLPDLLERSDVVISANPRVGRGLLLDLLDPAA